MSIKYKGKTIAGIQSSKESMNLLNTKADTSMNNLDSEGEKHFINKTQISNCLLEVPQRIKYELNNGTFTLKAGSVVIVPYGVQDKTADYPIGSAFINDSFKVVDTQYTKGKFFVWVETLRDIQGKVNVTDNDARSTCIVFKPVLNGISNQSFFTISGVSSGSTPYTGSKNQMLYRTDLNIVERYLSGPLQDTVQSFPFMRCTADGSNLYGSVDQVFNGMGYIGSVVWVDKDVKGLIPNGRNEDGTLKNIELNTSSILIYNNSSNGTFVLQLNGNSIGQIESKNYIVSDEEPTGLLGWTVWYNTTQNINYLKNLSDSTSVWSPQYNLNDFARVTRESGKIKSIRVSTSFQAADAQNTSWLSSLSALGTKAMALTAGASMSTYTAPQNGYFVIHHVSSGASQVISMEFLDGNNKVIGGISTMMVVAGNANWLCSPLIKCGNKIRIFYNSTKPVDAFNFIYAEGEV